MSKACFEACKISNQFKENFEGPLNDRAHLRSLQIRPNRACRLRTPDLSNVDLCSGCDQPLEAAVTFTLSTRSPAVQPSREQFHTDCFQCSRCKKKMSEKDSPCYVVRKKVFCHSCKILWVTFRIAGTRSNPSQNSQWMMTGKTHASFWSFLPLSPEGLTAFDVNISSRRTSGCIISPKSRSTWRASHVRRVTSSFLEATTWGWWMTGCCAQSITTRRSTEPATTVGSHLLSFWVLQSLAWPPVTYVLVMWEGHQWIWLSLDASASR